MAEQHNTPPRQLTPSTRAIPLQNLSRPPEPTSHASTGGLDPQDARTRYERELPTDAQRAASIPGGDAYWRDPFQEPAQASTQSQRHTVHDNDGDALAFQFALPPDIRQTPHRRTSSIALDTPSASDTYDAPSYFEGLTSGPNDTDSDTAPLASRAEPMAGLHITQGDNSRTSFQTIRDSQDSPSKPRNTGLLGYDLENGFSATKSQQHYGHSLTPEGRRARSTSTSGGALQRTASIVRAVSQRVVNISGDGDVLEDHVRRDRSRSRSPGADGREPVPPLPPTMMIDTSYTSHLYNDAQTPMEKTPSQDYAYHVTLQPKPPADAPMPNPLKGRSLGIFSPDNKIRLLLCELLVLPWTEPLLLVLIVLQTVLLAVEAGPNVFDNSGGRPIKWGTTWIDWALLLLFIIFSVELVIRVIVSGFVVNAAEYSSIDRTKGVKAAVAEQYRTIFQPHRQKSVKKSGAAAEYGPYTFARSVTMTPGQRLPRTVQEQQRMQLARRAFLRHGFNRLDFVAVISFWIAFTLGLTGVEKAQHLYIFKMLSCLRILRLLAITKGNVIILRSLKRAAPLLVRVSFLIAFFWLIFAIVGVQSFKSSLSRQCTWIDPTDPNNISSTYTNNFQFCGGHVDTENNKTVPWVYPTPPGTLNNLQSQRTNKGAKGFICPRGSICLQQAPPYNGTVHFDDILHSLELVFVIMSANTYSDLMYYTASSDYLPSALFFIAGILIMLLWLVNLLIAVITSSFQVIREESKASAFTDHDDTELVEESTQEKPKKANFLHDLYSKTSWIWILLIAYDLLCQAFRSALMMDNRRTFINASEIAITLLLDAEIIIRIVADFRNFARKPRNLVDLGLAIITTVILVPPIFKSGQAYAWLSVFQILRVYRVVLAIPMTRSLIQLVLGNATGIGNLMLFVSLITFFMAIFASQLFRGIIPLVDSSGNNIRINFASIWNSFLGVYQILSSENWTAVLYTVTGTTAQFNTSWVGALFLISWFILAFFILVNMFIAVIQENFDVGEDVKRVMQVKAFLQRRELGSASNNLALSTIFSLGRARRQKDPLDYGPRMMEMLRSDEIVNDFLDDPNADPLRNHTPPGPGTPTPNAIDATVGKPGLKSDMWSRFVAFTTSKDPNPFYSNVRFGNAKEALDPREMARQAVSATSERRKAQRAYLTRHPTYNNSLWIFGPQNKLRRLCQKVVGPGRGIERVDGVEPNKVAWYAFSAFIYAAIVAMVLLACVTTPLYQKQYFMTHVYSIQNWFVWTDLAFTVLFTVEAGIKVIADGFLWTPNAYFRSSWGVIDAVVLITLWINIITLFYNDGAVSRAVGAFKALRALRLLNVSDSARETFHSLLVVGWWKILSAMFVSLSLLIPFAIYGVNLFNGQLVSCSDGTVNALGDCSGEYSNSPYNWNMLTPRAASNPYYSFDDFGSSLFILYQIVSQEGWVDVSFAVQAITGRGLQPQFGASQGNAVFFVIFNLLATVFVLTLFISVFMRNYTEQTGVAFLTAEQRSWLELRKLLRQISPSKNSYDESKHKLKKWCHKRAIEKKGLWYVGITCLLVVHLVLLLLEYYTEPVMWTFIREVLFLVLILVYIANVAIRIVGLGWSRFRRSSWDLYSLVVVTGAFATSLLFLARPDFDTYIQLHKFFLVAIVFLLIPRNDALDQLFKTAAASLTTISNLMATWLVFFLMFAIALSQTFSLTRFGSTETSSINFRTVPNALILLFRMSTGEGWNQIMEDFATITAPLCVDSTDFYSSDCGSASWARVLFILWNILSMYIFVNLFVSLIYESFSYVYQRSSGLAAVDRDEIRRFKEAWRIVDPLGKGTISKEEFPRLLGELSGVFQMRIYEPEDSIGHIMEAASTTAPSIRHASITSVATLATGVNLQKLNQRLNQIDGNKVRQRRWRFNVFYEEVMVSADLDGRISFTSVLMILAHYKIINDNKSLKLDEFLRRRARLQRVEDAVRRQTVQDYFRMFVWRRKFKRHMEVKNAGRMTGIPQLDVPDILVDDEEERAQGVAHTAFTPSPSSLTPASTASNTPHLVLQRTNSSAFLSPHEAYVPQHERTWSASSDHYSQEPGSSGSGSGITNNIHNHGAVLSTAPNGGGTGTLQSQHPLALPRGQVGGSLKQQQQQQQHHYSRSSNSAFSFDLNNNGQESQQPGSGNSSANNSRRGSAVSPAQQMREILDDSVWVESIRRSATVKKRPSW